MKKKVIPQITLKPEPDWIDKIHEEDDLSDEMLIRSRVIVAMRTKAQEKRDLQNR